MSHDTPSTTPDSDVLAALKAVVGDKGWLAAPADTEPYLHDERDLYTGAAPLVLRPANAAEVAEIVRICAENNVGVVPQGGNTGYCGGAVPNGQVLVSLGRMNRVRAVDLVNATMTVEAGCVLKDVQDAAAEHGLLFPLSLAAEGTCQIGGNLSTNAGGIQVLRYGNARDLVLGLEVVTADGRVWDGLTALRKDNTGYDLKHLFMGAEGTLGIITAAVLKLYPQPKQTVTALVAAESADDLLALLARLRAATAGAVTSFEYMARSCLDLVLARIEGAVDPMAAPYAHYGLIELTSSRAGDHLRDTAEAALGDAFEAAEIVDAVLAESGDQAARLWRLRETIPEAQKRHGGCIKHDISVPLSKVPALLDQAAAVCRDAVPGVIVAPFGHMGDGNIHFNLCQPPDMARDAFLATYPDVTPKVHDIAIALGGSFSAEHGIGLLKKPELEHYKSDVERDLMRMVKTALDPAGIMNPGKVVPHA